MSGRNGQTFRLNPCKMGIFLNLALILPLVTPNNLACPFKRIFFLNIAQE